MNHATTHNIVTTELSRIADSYADRMAELDTEYDTTESASRLAEILDEKETVKKALVILVQQADKAGYML